MNIGASFLLPRAVSNGIRLWQAAASHILHANHVSVTRDIQRHAGADDDLITAAQQVSLLSLLQTAIDEHIDILQVFHHQRCHAPNECHLVIGFMMRGRRDNRCRRAKLAHARSRITGLGDGNQCFCLDVLRQRAGCVTDGIGCVLRVHFVLHRAPRK